MAYNSIFKPGVFAGQTIIGTGGGSGIGRCTAHELAFLGAHVLLVGRKADKLKTVAAEILEDGGKASYQTCDIRDEDAVTILIRQLISGSTLRIDGAASLGGRAWPIHKAQHSESFNGFHRAELPDVLKGKE